MSDRAPGPLPREWLPDPVSGAGVDDSQVWEWRLQRIMAAAEPRLVRLQKRREPWWSALGALWRPAAVAALGAAAAIVLVSPSVQELPPPGRFALSIIATEGSPEGLWASLGHEAEPVLSLIALEGGAP